MGKIGDRPDKVGPEPKPGMKKRGKKGKKEEDDFSSGSGQIATFMDKIENIMSGRDNEGMKKRQKKGILEDVITGGAAADFMEPSGLGSERKIKRQEKNKKDRKGKEDEGDDFSSGSGVEELKPESPAAEIMEGMDADVAAGVMEEIKTEVAAGVIEKMKPEAAAGDMEAMKPEKAAGDMEAMKPEKAAGDMEA